MAIFSHQQDVFAALCDTARAFFDGKWTTLRHRPRFTRLVVGPTGSGKSYVVGELARSLGLPMLPLCASSWIPLGAVRRGAEITWRDIKTFCGTHDRGIILVDELEKIRGDSTWLDATRPELFSLLDGSIPDAVLYHAEDEDDEVDPDASQMIKERLAERMLVVAAGAFQSHWDQHKCGVVGFHDQVAHEPEPLTPEEIAKVIPAEIGNRFVTPFLCLPPLRRADYESMLAETVAQLPVGLREYVRRRGESTIHEAIQNGQGARWIQQLVLHALIESSNSAVPPSPPSLHPDS